MVTDAFSWKTLPCTFWGNGNRTAIALLLTNDEEAIGCQSFWLFGDPSAMQKEWANGVSGNPKKFGVKIKSHEKPQSHLDASIAFGRWEAGQRINRVQEQAIATEATFWRKCLLRIINIVMTLAMMSLALRRHREHVDDGDWHGGSPPRW